MIPRRIGGPFTCVDKVSFFVYNQNRMRKFLKATALFFLVMSLIISYSIFDMARTVRVTLVITGILQGNVISFKATGDPYKGMMVGGMPFLVSRIKELQKKALKTRSDFFVLDVGDDFPGTSQSYYSQCKSVVDTMNLMGITAMSLGNREFDYGLEVLKARAGDASFPILAANVKSRATGKAFDGVFRDSIVLEPAGGRLKIGVLGMAPPETVTDSSSKNIAEISFASETETVAVFKKKMDEIRADFTIALTQVDIKKDARLFSPYTAGGLNMVIGLDFYNECNRISKIGETLVLPLHGLAKGTEITKAELVFDSETGSLIEYSMEKIPIFVNRIDPDPECARIISDYLRKLDVIMNEVIGCADADLKRPFNEETNFGNLICDYMLKYSSCEVALQNSGSLRSEIGRGDITVGNLYDVLPFDNDIVVMEIDGATLFDIINTCCLKERGLLQISGGSYEYDPNRSLNSAAAQGSSSSEVAVVTKFLVGGSPIEPLRKYKVAVNSFLASGQGGYPQFKKCRTLAIMENLREVVEKNIRTDRRVNPVVEGRIVRVAGGIEKK